jgi:hypothetical protein
MTDSITPTQHSSLVGGSTAARRSRRPAADLTPEEVRRFLHYSPQTGRFWWKIRSYDTFNGDEHTQNRCGKAWNQKYAGTRALTADSEGRGYLVGSLNGANVYAHRVAWLHYHGERVPDGMFVDHINGDPSDNRISNLRLVTPLQSQFNRAPRKDSKAGLKGVAFDNRKKSRPWMAMMAQEGTVRTLGYFKTPEEAAECYEAAARAYHGEFGYHNREEGKGK